MNEIKYPALPQSDALKGNEAIALGERNLATVQDYWRWAYSNINDNATRGHFAEFIVRAVLGCANGTRVEWDPYDILWEGIKIEVKSSAYLQTWAQKELSRISFRIRQTHSWDPLTNEEDSVARRQADVYIFCIENCKDQSIGNPNPLDLAQWEFRVLPTSALDALGSQKTLSLTQLDKLNVIKVVDVFNLPDAVRQAACLCRGGASDGQA